MADEELGAGGKLCPVSGAGLPVSEWDACTERCALYVPSEKGRGHCSLLMFGYLHHLSSIEENLDTISCNTA